MSGGGQLPVSSLIDARVTGSDGEALGIIREVLIDAATGSVVYVALAVGGVMGVGERLLAMPWQAFAADADSGTIRAHCRLAELADDAGFDKDAWPAAADAALAARFAG